MRIKKFQAENISQALRIVRDRLGDNALILSTKKIRSTADGVHQAGIEVVAAIDDSISTEGPSFKSQRRISPKKQKQNFAARVYQGNIRTGSPVSESIAMAGLPFSPATKRHDKSPEDSHNPFVIRLQTALQIAGVHREIIDKILFYLTLDTPQTQLQQTDQLVEVMSRGFKKFIRSKTINPKKISKPYILCLVGPTGVGKTTSLAKIAANMKIEHKQKVGLVSIDTFRIAAIDQLRTFAHIAEMPLKVAYTPDDLVRALQAFEPMDFVLIDTTGRSPREESYHLELNRFLEVVNPSEIHLVLSATTRFAEMEEIVHQYRQVGFNRLLLTKIDEVMHPAILLNLYKLSTAPVAYVTNGQNIPEDLLTADADTLASYLVKAWNFDKWIN